MVATITEVVVFPPTLDENNNPIEGSAQAQIKYDAVWQIANDGTNLHKSALSSELYAPVQTDYTTVTHAHAHANFVDRVAAMQYTCTPVPTE